MHSKNIIAPQGIPTMLCFLGAHVASKRYFLNQKTQQCMENYFHTEGLELREHRIMSNAIPVFIFLFSLLIGFQLWIAVTIAILLFGGLEMWISYRFQ